MAVAPELLAEFLVRAQNVLKRNQATASLFCHAGQGQVHLQPFLDLANADDVRRMRRLAEELYQEVLALEGSIGGVHASGLSRTQFIRQQAGPLYDVFVEIKRIFDPTNLLNPGKIIGDDPDLMMRHLRPPIPSSAGWRQTAVSACRTAARAHTNGRAAGPQPAATVHAVVRSSQASPGEAAGGLDDAAPPMRNLVELQLNWEPARVRDAVDACNRCGECRTQAVEFRMCPLFRVVPSEEASPRAKANMIRGVLTGALDLQVLTSAECKAVADLCVHCHSCRFECPAGVDIPRLMREGKGAFVRANGLTLAEWAMTRLDLLARWAAGFAPLVNWVLKNRAGPLVAGEDPGHRAGAEAARGGPRTASCAAPAAGFPAPSATAARKCSISSTFTPTISTRNWPRPPVAVLEHNGIRVFVHPDQKQAGMASIACGALDHARQLAKHNVTILADSVRQGYHLVATEPAAALCLTHEYPQMLDDDDARLVAAHSSEAGSYLWRMHTLGQLATRSQAVEPDPGLPYAVPSPGAAGGLAGREPVGLDPRPAPAPRRERLFGHGRHVRALAPQLSQQPAGRAASSSPGSAIPTSRRASPNAALARYRWNKAPQNPPSTPSSSWPSPTA